MVIRKPFLTVENILDPFCQSFDFKTIPDGQD